MLTLLRLGELLSLSGTLSKEIFHCQQLTKVGITGLVKDKNTWSDEKRS